MIVSNTFSPRVENLADLKTYQVGVLEAASHRALRAHKDSLLRGYGLTGVDWYLIGTVADAGEAGIRSTDLASTVGVTMGFLTKTVGMLDARNILQKTANAQDGRSAYIRLHPDYQTTFEEVEAALRDKLRHSLYNLITPEELKIYISVLNKFSTLDK